MAVARTTIDVRYGTGLWRSDAARRLRTLPWTVLDIRISFSARWTTAIAQGDILFSDAVSLTNLASTAYTWDNVNKIGVWSFAGISRAVIKVQSPTLRPEWRAYLRILKGDSDGDGIVTLKDAILLRQYNGQAAPADSDVAYYDIDGNGTINLIDALVQRGVNGASIEDYKIPTQFFDWMREGITFP